MGKPTDFDGGAAREDGLRGPLHDKDVLTGPCRKYRQATPFEVEGHFREPYPVIDAISARREDRFIQWTSEAGLESAVQMCKIKDAIAVLPLGVDMRCQRNLGFC